MNATLSVDQKLILQCVTAKEEREMIRWREKIKSGGKIRFEVVAISDGSDPPSVILEPVS